MPYCQKCGTKLTDDTIYCFKCGTPTNPTEQTPQKILQNTPNKEKQKNPKFTSTIIIIALTFTLLIITMVTLTPFKPVYFNEQTQIEQQNPNKLTLDVHANIGDINIYTNLTDSDQMKIDISATGGTSIFRLAQPVTFNVQNNADNLTQKVVVDVSSQKVLFSENLQVTCSIYLNPQTDLTLNVHSEVGRVNFVASSEVKISSLKLETTTGNVNLDLQKDTIVKGDVTVLASKGNVWFGMSQIDVPKEYVMINLSSNIGNVGIVINQTQMFNGDLQITAHADTGNVNLNHLLIDKEVAAKIQATTDNGNVHISTQNFNGKQTWAQSNNYPSRCNINMNLSTNKGNITIRAIYQTNIEPTLRI